MIRRSDLFRADVGDPTGSRPAKRRPVLVIQSDPYNSSRLATVLVAVATSNTTLATMPGNTFLPAVVTGLPRDCVVDVTALVTLDRSDLTDRVGQVPVDLMADVDRGLRRVLGLKPSSPPPGRPSTAASATDGRGRRSLSPRRLSA